MPQRPSSQRRLGSQAAMWNVKARDPSFRWGDEVGNGTMKLGRLNHIGVATPSLEASIAYYRDVIGATIAHKPFDLPAQGVKVCFVDTPGGNSTAGKQIELIEPLGDKTTIHGFIAKNPADGQQSMTSD